MLKVLVLLHELGTLEHLLFESLLLVLHLVLELSLGSCQPGELLVLLSALAGKQQGVGCLCAQTLLALVQLLRGDFLVLSQLEELSLLPLQAPELSFVVLQLLVLLVQFSLHDLDLLVLVGLALGRLLARLLLGDVLGFSLIGALGRRLDSPHLELGVLKLPLYLVLAGDDLLESEVSRSHLLVLAE